MSDPRQSAAELLQKAYELQMACEYQQAIELYARSIEIFPSAGAYTFRGWAYSFLGNYDRAIAECLEAIKLDPEFGNPYNDIGAYLIEQEKWDEAIPWFQKATIAPRYEARCYPHFNLGCVYEPPQLAKGQRVLRDGVFPGQTPWSSAGRNAAAASGV